jgi:hypothetical protein
MLMSVIPILLLLTPIERRDRLLRRGLVKSITSEVMHFDLMAWRVGLFARRLGYCRGLAVSQKGREPTRIEIKL